jgi:NPCBM-associated, NEW3 domain of alpha-galactosidase
MIKTFYVLAIFVFSLYAQSSTNFNKRDDEYTLLGLKRAKAAFEMADTDYNRLLKLYQDGFVSEQEIIRAKQARADAEVNYQQSLLSVIFEGQYVSVDKAVKYQQKDGSKHARITLSNMSGGAEFDKLIEVDDALFRSLQPDVVNDVYVSLLNDDNTIISQPYESKIEVLKHGHPVEIDFELLQDVDVVSVNIVFSNGKNRAPKIFLQKDNSANKVILQSDQFAQEVELGGAAEFDLNLELFSGEGNTFRLEVVNLPASINRYFVDNTTNARLRQIKFSERSNTISAKLNIFLPELPSAEVKIDTPIAFYILAIPISFKNSNGKWSSRQWTEQELNKLNLGFVRLEINPRGTGKLLVRAPQLFYSIEKDQPVEARIELKNEGSRALNNVQIETDLPLNWRKQVDPDVIKKLAIGEEQIVSFTFFPPQDVSPGRYEIRIRTRSLSDEQPVEGEDKNITIEIKAETNLFGMILLVLFIVGIIGGMVVFGIKLTRK